MHHFSHGFLTKEAVVRIALIALILLVNTYMDETARVSWVNHWYDHRNLYQWPTIKALDKLLANKIVVWILLLMLSHTNLCYVLWSGLRYRLSDRKRARIAAYNLLSLTLGWLLIILIGSVVKRLVGRPRPDLLGRCYPHMSPGNLLELSYAMDDSAGKHKTPFGTTMSFGTSKSFGTFYIPECSQTNRHVMREGWMSFPAITMSLAVATLLHTAAWDLHVLKYFAPSHGENAALTASIIRASGEPDLRVHHNKALEPYVLPPSIILLSLTLMVVRLWDTNRHHTSDYLAAALFAAIATAASFYFYYFRRQPVSEESLASPGTAAPFFESASSSSSSSLAAQKL